MNDQEPLIRITREDATSREVDDFLKRQMSLRGDAGVTRNEARHWYYQSWFVLMVVGFLGALAAWALFEPWYDDVYYTQGKVEVVDAGFIEDPGQESQVLPQLSAQIRVNGETVLVLPGVREIFKGRESQLFDVSTLKAGDVAGFHLDDGSGVAQRDGSTSYQALYAVRDPALLKQGPVDSLHRQAARELAMGFMIFPIVAGMIGLALGAADGAICRLPRRAILCGVVGLLVGAVGGLVSGIVANVVYTPIHGYAENKMMEESGFSIMSFGIQMAGRTLAWALAGTAMGLGQGIALRSSRLMGYGFIGGVVGGVLGGLFFDPISLLLSGDGIISGHWSRFAAITVIGASVGGMTGVVELLARDAWLRMTQGPLKGKEFLIFKDLMRVGSSPRSDLYLFNDSRVHEEHAVIRGVGDECEIEATHPATHPVLVNGRAVTRCRLKHGDDVGVGSTHFVFQKRKS